MIYLRQMLLDVDCYITRTLRHQRIPSITITANWICYNTIVPRLVRFFKRLFYAVPLLGFGFSICRYSAELTFYSSQADASLYSKYSTSPVFLNLGSGGFDHPGWHSFDLKPNTKYYRRLQGSERKNLTYIDLSNRLLRLPYDINSVDLLYISHALEHLSYSR